MTPKLKLLYHVVKRLENVKDPFTGGLYGIMYERTLLVVGMSISISSRGVESYLEMQKKYPTGLDFCGIVSVQENIEIDPPVDAIKDLKEVFVTDNPVFIYKSTGSNDICSFFFRNERLVVTEFDIMDYDKFFSTFITLRLQTSILLSTGEAPKNISKALENLQKKVSSGGTIFHLVGTNYFINGGESRDYGCHSDCSLGELYESMHLSNDCRLKKGALQVSMLFQSSNEEFEGSDIHAPFITSTIDPSKKMVMLVPIDALCLAQKKRIVEESYGLLVDTVCRSINLFSKYIFRYLEKPEQISELRQYHFFPPSLGHYVTLIYPKYSKDEELKEIRENMHQQLGLSMENPIFRKGNSLIFLKNLKEKSLLINVHEGLKPSGVQDGEVYLVKGFYSYYHYMQDNFDDTGWGCAYRSFQTLFSWFRWQGYTEKNIPFHIDIQKCLVDIKDKRADFIGSKQWIGSTEVAFCLETMLGIPSRIISVSCGDELSSIGNELVYHFSIQGTPVMIGGGVLAHTILGVHYNQDSGDIKFLVLDPHYTGIDDIKIIQNRGWVGWKDKNFWDKKSFYNLCMPQKQNVI